MTGLKNPIGDRHGEPASVWRENELAVVILLRVLARFTGHPRSTDLLIQATFKIAIFVKNFLSEKPRESCTVEVPFVHLH